MAFKLGLQVFSVREDASKNFADAMKRIKEMGYDGVELAGNYGHSKEYVKEVFADLDLIPISAHVMASEMIGENSEKTFEFYTYIGCKYIAVPWMPEESRPDREGFLPFVETVRHAGEIAKTYGIQLLYHNHDFEFRKIGKEYGLDYIYRNIPEDILKTELDTCWINIGGESPAAYIKKYSGRAPVVHLKDFFKEEECSNEGMYELIGIEKKIEFNRSFEFRPIGHGMQNIPLIVAASEEAGTEWFIVEQDRPSLGLAPMECAELSVKYLRSIGL